MIIRSAGIFRGQGSAKVLFRDEAKLTAGNQPETPWKRAATGFRAQATALFGRLRSLVRKQ